MYPLSLTDTRVQNPTGTHRDTHRGCITANRHTEDKKRAGLYTRTRTEAQGTVKSTGLDTTVSLSSYHCTRVRTCTHTQCPQMPTQTTRTGALATPHSSSNRDWHTDPCDACVHLTTHTQLLNTHNCLCIPTLTLRHAHTHICLSPWTGNLMSTHAY